MDDGGGQASYTGRAKGRVIQRGFPSQNFDTVTMWYDLYDSAGECIADCGWCPAVEMVIVCNDYPVLSLA